MMGLRAGRSARPAWASSFSLGAPHFEVGGREPQVVEPSHWEPYLDPDWVPLIEPAGVDLDDGPSIPVAPMRTGIPVLMSLYSILVFRS